MANLVSTLKSDAVDLQTFPGIEYGHVRQDVLLHFLYPFRDLVGLLKGGGTLALMMDSRMF